MIFTEISVARREEKRGEELGRGYAVRRVSWLDGFDENLMLMVKSYQARGYSRVSLKPAFSAGNGIRL